MEQKSTNKKQVYYFLYKTTNKINGKYYIGAHTTSNLDDGYLGSGTLILRAISKYGKENFIREILQFFNSSEELYLAERQLVDEKFILDDNNYNVNIGGKGGFLPMAGEKNPFYGKKHSFETRQKMSEAAKHRKPMSENHKQAIGKAILGVKPYTNGKVNIKLHDNQPIPPGFYYGVTRHKKYNKSKNHINWYTNGIKNIILHDTEEVPQGFHLGRTSECTGKRWYTNGVLNIKLNPNKEKIPDGYYQGLTQNKNKMREE